MTNICIWHWRKTGLQTFLGHPFSSHIGCLDLCLHQHWSLDRVIVALRQVDWFYIKFKLTVLSVIFYKISLPVIQIWWSHFCLAIIVWESMVANSCIQHWHKTGLRIFWVIPPHLILVAWICACIKFEGLERVIDALRQVSWFHIKFKLFVNLLPFARFPFLSSKFGHHISVCQLKCESKLWQIVVFGMGTR